MSARANYWHPSCHNHKYIFMLQSREMIATTKENEKEKEQSKTKKQRLLSSGESGSKYVVKT